MRKTPKTTRVRKQKRNRRGVMQKRGFETLEGRRVLALLGLAADLPVAFANNTGTVQFDSVTGDFTADALPLTFRTTNNPFIAARPITGAATFDLAVQLDSSGLPVAGQTGNDFTVTGDIDIDGDSVIDVSGTLLEGTVIDFGFADAPPTDTDFFDFRISIVGGLLATSGTLSGGSVRPNYFAGKDIGVTITSEFSNFGGVFTSDFSGGNKANVFPTDPVPDPQFDAAIEVVKYVDKVITTSSMHVLDFDSLAAGDVVGSQLPGVTITGVANSAPGAGNRAMVFDSSSPTGGDSDLGTPSVANGGPGQGGGIANDTALGNILILSEDGDGADPDDDAKGGTITFDFDEAVQVNYIDLLDIDTDENGGSIVTLTTTSGSQSFPIASLGNNSYQRIPLNVDDVTSLTVDLVSSGAVTELKFTKFESEKQWFDANDAPGVEFSIGETVEFSYHVTNPFATELSPVILVDDNATPSDPSDDFSPTPVLNLIGNNIGDTDNDGRLDQGEEWIFTASFVASEVGQFENLVIASGTPVGEDGTVLGDPVVDDDPANYFISGVPGISIEKLTNGVDADIPSEAVEIAAGDVVTWTYQVTNTGSTTFAQADVSITDDNGTPGDASDDFSPMLAVASDVGSDGLLSPGEVWTYTATDTALSLRTDRETQVLWLDGNSPLDGPDGNIRDYFVADVSITARAYSKDDSGVYDPAYLGAFSGGLGVTDTSEGDGTSGTHRVDNLHRENFVVFTFSEPVVVDSAFLDSVVHDSDLSVWLGTVGDPFSVAANLGDSVLDSLISETNNTAIGSARWADFNAAGAQANVLVLAASLADDTPDDRFKISKLKFDTVANAIYGNLATVDADSVSDTDPSHYQNPEPEAVDIMFEAEDYEWADHPWTKFHDSDASGGQALVAPNHTGSHYDSPPHGKRVKYQFDVDVSARYELSAIVKAVSGRDNSVWVRVDGGDWIQWHTPVTGSEYALHEVTQGWDRHAITFDLDVGEHMLEVRVREDGTVLDKWVFAPQDKTTIQIDAADPDSINGDWEIRVDSDGNEYVVAADGSGPNYHTPPAGDELTYDFELSRAGTFSIAALVGASSNSTNSFWVAVNDGEWVQWHLAVTGSGTSWQTVTDGFEKSEVTFDLEAGIHSLKIKVREAGTRLDQIMITNDPGKLP